MNNENSLMPLGTLEPDETATMAALSGGRTFTSRCLALGFTPGAEVKMERNSGRGPVVVVVRGIRLALGRDESMRLTVRSRRN